MNTRFIDRFAFSQQISLISLGATKDRVQSLIGKPDRVMRIENERDGFYGDYSIPLDQRGDEVWLYGAAESPHFSSLGQVRFGADGLVSDVSGQGHPDLRLRAVPEADLRIILRRVHELSPICGSIYNPLPTIKLANFLLQFDRDLCCAILREYVRVCGAEGWAADCFSVLLLTMFVPCPPLTHFPLPCIGEIAPAPPVDRSLASTYPVLVCQDVPFCLITGRLLAGVLSPLPIIDYFQSHGNLRLKALAPPDNAATLLEQLSTHPLLSSDKWLEKEVDRYNMLWILLTQTLRLVGSFYHPSLPSQTPNLPEEIWREWNTHRDNLRVINSYWKPSDQVYYVR